MNREQTWLHLTRAISFKCTASAKLSADPPVTCASSVYVYSCQTGAGRTRGRTTQPGNEDIKVMQEGAVQAMKCAKIGKTNETK